MKHGLFIPIVFVSIIFIAGGLGFYVSGIHQDYKQSHSQIQGLLWPHPKVINHFSLIDDEGQEFNRQNLLGRWSFLFFGFTHCPDICPTTLSILNQVHENITNKNRASDIQVLFTSVDSERDHPEQLRTYVNYFNPEFTGLGGNPEHINSLTKQLGVAYFIGKKNSDGNYTVDHNASIFLIDPRGRLVGIYSMPHQADEIARRFFKIKNFIEQQG